MVEIIKADLLDCPCDIIAQSNNCFCVQGSGLARSIARKWPEVLRADKRTIKGDKSKMGTCNFVNIQNPTGQIKTVALMYSQYRYGTNERQVNYEALYRCLKTLNEWAIDHKLRAVGLPYYLSSDLAGGDWSVVYAIICSIFSNSPVKILICNKD